MPQPRKKTSSKTRKEHRPRVDAIVRHIKAGSYDDEISQIRGAIDDRMRAKQEAVLGLVKEAFGDDFVVQPAQRWTPIIGQQGALQPSSEWEEAARAAEQQEQQLRDQLGEDDLPDADPDYESRSPIIGSIETPPEPVAEEAAEKPNPFLPKAESQ